MKRASEIEEAKASLLRELNERRAREGKPALASYPDAGCTSCGEMPASGVPLFATSVPYIRTCQDCVLKEFPFRKLRLSRAEKIMWYRNNPTFHRSSDYGIVLTDQALYLYSPFWFVFARWRRIPLSEIRGAEFRDSRLFPALHVQRNGRDAVLRTPPDYPDEMEYDRRNLIEAAERLRTVIQQ